MNYPRIIAALRSAKWAALPSTIQAVYDSLASTLRGNAATNPASGGKSASTAYSGGGVSIIPVYGIIGRNLSQLETMCGGVDVNTIREGIEAAVADSTIEVIILDFDSPGGVITGVPELAAFIRAASDEKPIFAFTGGQCCSAAYWLASACDGVYCTTSADVGSIGVYVALVDESAAWAKDGYKLELIKAGQFKAAGIPGGTLDAEARALIQADVDTIYDMFTADVQKARPDVGKPSMQGQTFMGKAAVANGMVDEIVSGIDEMLEKLAA